MEWVKPKSPFRNSAINETSTTGGVKHLHTQVPVSLYNVIVEYVQVIRWIYIYIPSLPGKLKYHAS